MVVIGSVIAVVSVVSLYEYYSARNWQQVTSNSRNNVVFEHRNQKYGAFVIRRDYDKLLVKIIFGFGLIIFGLYAYSNYFIIRGKSLNMGQQVETYINTPLILEPKAEPEVIKKEKIDIKPKIEKPIITQEFLTLTASDDTINNKTLNTEEMTNPGNKDITSGEIGGSKGIDSSFTTLTVTNKGPEKFPDVKALFPGGNEARIKYLNNNIHFPEFATEGGKCYIQFVVSSTGEISSVKLTREIENCSECNKEAIRVIKNMPKWKPAILNNVPVDSYYNMTISFVVE